MHMQFNLVNFMVLFFYACTKDYRAYGRPTLIRMTIIITITLVYGYSFYI